MKIFLFLTYLTACIISCFAATDTYGENPKHEFGEVWSGKTKPLLPFWALEGSASALQDFVRLTPDRQSHTGAIWNTEPNYFTNWEVIYKFKIHGSGVYGADGLGFWYVKHPKTMGEFFGVPESFNGLGVVIDTYDNDGTGFHPRLLVLKNDGTKVYEHSHGVQPKEDSMELGSCSIASARSNIQTTSIKVSYLSNLVQVEIDSGSTGAWTVCASSKVELPPGYHFGFSAATGQLADNHDIYGITVKNLDANGNLIDNIRGYSQSEPSTVLEYANRLLFKSIHRTSDPNAPLNLNDKLQSVQSVLQRIESVANKMQSPANAANPNLNYQLLEIKNMIFQLKSEAEQTGTQSSSILSLLWYLVIGLVLLSLYFGLGSARITSLFSKKKHAHDF